MPNVNQNDMHIVYDRLFPVFIDSEFLTKTQFDKLTFFLCMVKDECTEHEISYQYNKKNKALWVNLTFHRAEMQYQIENNYESFMLQHLALLLKNVCHKYDLNVEQVDSLLATLNIQKMETVQNCTVENVGRVNNEVRIFVRLIVGNFGDAADIDQNTILMKKIDQCLHDEGIGSIVEASIGSGYETIYCGGPDANVIYESLSGIIPELPPGSYVEIDDEGTTKQITL